MDSNYCQIVENSLNGEKAVDEQTFAALEILKERLERLKKLNPGFDSIEFSAAVKRLLKQNNKIPVY